ncbi:E3 ubiquitin-protein ligase UHRF1-like [Dysidea avara]|uniref:E3 ubiquitin-protein ligase UHRF1-like n=1 Tax=Dysidea avara TaxID=196820 RepID=UPI003326341A
MWIQVRSMDGQKNVRIDNLSKLTKIEDLREKLVDHFNAGPERQRLFFRGKQLVDGHTLFDYDVGLNEIVQILVKPVATDTASPSKKENGVTEQENGSQESSDSGFDAGDIDTLYKVGEKVDARDIKMGAWFEARILRIIPPATKPNSEALSSSSPQNFDIPSYLYRIAYDGYPDEENLEEKDIRPRARHKRDWEDVNVGDTMMINHNCDDPKQRGYWYDGCVTKKYTTDKGTKKLFCKLLLGTGLDSIDECEIKFLDEMFEIEPPKAPGVTLKNDEGEKKTPECPYCNDKPSRRKCYYCHCRICDSKDDAENTLLCDECDNAYHMQCLDPPVTSLPTDEQWFCPDCKNDTSAVVTAGEKLKMSKKKSKMMSNINKDCTRDWGKGMACVGRTKVCTIVPSNHFGAIPGVPVGTLWKFRVQVSESGVHRPHVAGIHGRENEGAYSIVLSGGYEDDKDSGKEFTYTGSGGRDLSGNRRTAPQSSDQQLTHMNRALAKNCDAPISEKGAKAKDWQKGKPVRVVRNCKEKKISKYAPEEGNRYDGIYKVVEYWSQKGSSGFLVWKFLLKRDDPSPAPWEKEGQKMAKKLNLVMQYPEGYLESKQAAAAEASGDSTKGKSRKRKSNSAASPAKKARNELSRGIKQLIGEDDVNKKIWDELLAGATQDSSKGFLPAVEDAFKCICCQEVVFQPVTTSCGHNVCKGCLGRSFKAEVYSCPNCRYALGEDYEMQVNQTLKKILLDLFPGYTAGR